MQAGTGYWAGREARVLLYYLSSITGDETRQEPHSHAATEPGSFTLMSSQREINDSVRSLSLSLLCISGSRFLSFLLSILCAIMQNNKKLMEIGSNSNPYSKATY